MKKITRILNYIYYLVSIKHLIAEERHPDGAVYYYCCAKYKGRFFYDGYFNSKKSCRYALKRFTAKYIKEKI